MDNAEKRVHILEGLKIALDNIDEIIQLIKAANSDDEARTGLMSKFGLSEVQANAILEMKLRRLTGLEREKIENELADLLKLIGELRLILSSDEKILDVIKNELLEIKDKYGDERRTTIDMTAIEYIEDESLIPVEQTLITLTNKGYIKRMPVDAYRTQNRGGVGIKGMTTNEEDFVEKMLNMSTHDYILFFTNKGKVYRMKGYEIPEYSRQSKGLPVINLLPLEKEEYISSVVTLSSDEHSFNYLLFITRNGLVKRTNLSEFDNIRSSGKLAITLKDDDELISVRKTTGENEVLIGASNGRMVRFNEKEIRVMGRTASGVKGMELDGAIAVGGEVVDNSHKILVVTVNGYGKKTEVNEYRLTHRGSKGVMALHITEKNGNMVSLKAVTDADDLIIITDNGIIMRMPMDQISTLKRATQGVRLIHLKDDQRVATVSVIDSTHDEVEEEQIEN